ncbi:hypothetical protein KSK55_09015 [Methanospirillum purgamenti]|uniref:Rhamnan synthesis protein F n=1 Tax=Methanospirillum hungatei TaxID=2203 RepID=A0A8F5ZFK9_METHU|nr:rhamnan synthesis F family protein [Methanospirillum hungatei]QXO93524.1 hypothetical protein KSK55_09015 [Methanospirillum hungatei]
MSKHTYIQFITFIQGCQDYRYIKKSIYFDPNWYTSKYRDVAVFGINPAWHYAHYGWREHRNPGPNFSTQFYLNNYPDIKKAGINPLIHYEKIGFSEGRLPKPDLLGLNRDNKVHSIKSFTSQSVTIMEDVEQKINHSNIQSVDIIKKNVTDTVGWQIFLFLKRKFFHFLWHPISNLIERNISLFHDGLIILKKDGFKALIIAAKRHIKNCKNPKYTQFIGKRDGFGEKYSINPTQFIMLTDKKIVVHAHVYYIDLFDEICEFLQNIPYNFTLLISVTQHEHKQVITEKLKQIPHLEYSIIRVVENRGRDLAPLFVEFESIIREYDYICHIHTKKSLYSGKEQKNWRKHLFEGVLGSEQLIRAIFTAFLKDPKLGIIYPEIFPELTYIACTWLSNKNLGSIIANRLNIQFDPDIYFDYPIGSIFWIKREALEPLLDLNLQLTDFPEESGQNDGTLQHALERCFVLSAQSKGFHHLVVTNPKLLHLSYKSSKNFQKYFCQPSIIEILPFISVVSFDLFDTLLIRPFATPHMVFSYLEERIFSEYGIKGFKNLRQKAESFARKKKNYQGDVKLSEIYATLSEISPIDNKTASEMLNLEFSTELEILIPRKEVIDAAREAKNLGKRLILISDTYFEETHIRHILESKGIDFFDKLYLSSETGKRKDRGDLWDYVIESEGLIPDKYLHVGDNEETDWQRLFDKGYGIIIHVIRPTALFQMTDFGAQLWSTSDPYKNWRDNLLFGKYANFFCLKPNNNRMFSSSLSIEEPYSFGYIVFGPIIFNFIVWLIKNSQKKRCDHLWFLAREGHLLHSAYMLVVNHLKKTDENVKYPTSEYFLCSRRSVTFPLLQMESDLHILLDGEYRGNLRDFFTKRLNVSSLSNIEDILGSQILEMKISLPEDYTILFGHLQKVLPQLLVEAQKERELFLAYCHSMGFDEEAQIGVVDLGYSGTIQKALMELLCSDIHGYYFITSNYSKKVNRATVFEAYYGKILDPSDIRQYPLFMYSLLLEAVLTSPKGQLIRFSSGLSGDIYPVFKEAGKSQIEFTRIDQIHKGILTFIEEMLDQFGDYALEIEFPIQNAQRCFIDVVNGAIDIGGLKGTLSVEDDHTGMGEINVLKHYNDVLRQHNPHDN